MIAFSGGKDSLALLDYLHYQNCNFSYELFACYIHHGIRENAYLDVEFCKKFCYDKGICFKVEDIGDSIKSEKNSSLEAVARKYRYIALEKHRYELGCDYILTAHTYDDQIESFFIDLLTGSSIYTLGGIQEKNNKIVRPMLNIRTKQVENYLDKRGLQPIYDITNSDDKYLRNAVRHKVIPLFNGFGAGYENTIIRLQNQSRALHLDYEEHLKIIEEKENIILIEKDKFARLKSSEQEFILGKVLSKLYRVERVHITNALTLIEGGVSRRIDIGSGYCFEVSYNTLAIFHVSYVQPFKMMKYSSIDNISSSCFNIEFNNSLAISDLTIRSRNAGDRLNGKKIKNLFIDKKIELYKRDRAIIIEKDSTIIYVEYLTDCDKVKIDRNK